MIITRQQIRKLMREAWYDTWEPEKRDLFFTEEGKKLGSQIEGVIDEMKLRFPLTMVTLGKLREKLKPLGVWDIDYSEEERTMPENLYFQAGDYRENTYLEFRWTPKNGLEEI